ncbi:uncharacterized protein LOC144138991 [Haemaphysalis longicornis]
MRAGIITAACAVTMAFLLPGFGTAQCAGDLKCKNVAIKDTLGLSECLEGTLDVCGDSKEKDETESPDQKLSRCIIKSRSMVKITVLLLNTMREAIQLSLELLSPGSGRTLFVLLQQVESEVETQNVQERSLQRNGWSQCNRNITVTLPENTDISRCVEITEGFCRPSRRNEQ